MAIWTSHFVSLLMVNFYTFSGIEIGINSNAGLGGLVTRINNSYDKTGVKASCDVHTIGTASITAGKTGSDFSINEFLIGKIAMQDNERNGALVQAINSVKVNTGVEAAINAFGIENYALWTGEG